MRIIGPASAPFATVLANIPSTAHPRFISDIVPAVWRACTRYKVDGVGGVSQAGKECAWGNFNGDNPDPHKVTWWFYNTCGLKIEQHGRWPETSGDMPFAHTIFPNWETGARAHIQHLCAYAGVELPADDLCVDPRWRWVAPRFAGAGLENWSELGGPNRWAPNPNYGVEIETIMKRLQGKTP